ncbi:MAG: cytochrome bc complex cytochrome b subunit [Chloroflexi bacterium]|nr:cytochrome bc complex cytochrome b subunit [Chloroflexota bacterium]
MSIIEQPISPYREVKDQTETSSGERATMATWIDERTGLVSANRAFLSWPVPKYVERNLLYSLGGLTLVSLIYQFFSGICLLFYYDPSAEAAYNSVDYITYQAPLGWLVRSIHHYNASAIVILVFLHLLRTFFFSAYKAPREVTWLSGVVLFLITLGFGFTGYLLPWDQKGYWATRVGTEMAGQVPLLGSALAQLMRGGATLGQLTLNRFFVTHVALLPGALVLLLALHLYQHRYHGVAPTISKRGQIRARHSVPYFPNWVIMDVLLGLGLLALLIYLSWHERAPLAFPANPADTDYSPKPEWYFLFLFHLLHYVPGRLEPFLIVVVPLLVIGSMFLLPFLDTGEERRPWRKPVTTAVALFYVAVIIIFTFLGS